MHSLVHSWLLCKIGRSVQHQLLKPCIVIPEVVNIGNAWKCAFLHSEGRHSQPLHPIDTILEPKCTWNWELPEHVPSFMWVALRAEMDWIKHTWCMYTLMWWFPWENGSNHHKTPTTQPFFSLLLQQINKVIIKIFQIGVIWYEEFVVKSRVHAAAD